MSLLKHWPWVILLSIFLWATWPSLFLPLDRDEGAYAYIGWLWFSGNGIPYLSVFDHKPPLVYLPYAIASLIFGNTILGIRILSLAWSIVTVFVFYKLSQKISGEKIAILATAIFILFSSSISIEGLNFNVEPMLLFPMLFISLLLGNLVEKKDNNSWKWYAAGLLTAILIWTKPVTIYFVILISVWAIARIKKTRPFLSMIGGITSLSLLILSYFYFADAIQYLINDVFVYNRLYVKEAFLANNICYQAFNGFSCYIFWLFRIVPFLVIAVPAIMFTLVHRLNKGNVWKEVAIIVIAGAWLGIKGAGGKDYVHYYLLLIPGAVLSIAYFLDVLLKKRLFFIFLLYTISLFAWYILFDKAYETPAKRLKHVIDSSDQRVRGVKDAPAIAEWLKTRIDKNESLMIWANEPQIYFYLAKPAMDRNINFFALKYSRSEEGSLLNTFTNNHPDWLVTYNNQVNIYFPEQISSYNQVWTNGTYKIFMKTGKH